MTLRLPHSATCRLFLGLLLTCSLGHPTMLSGQASDTNAVYEPGLYSAMKYRMIGPFRGGRVTAVTGIAAQPYTFYMGSTGGGLWKTTDAGVTWTNVSDSYFEAGSIGDVKVAPSDPSVVYVGTGSACPRGNISAGIGVYRSSNGGKTWRHIGLREAGQIGEIAVHPSNPDLLFVAALGHMFGPSADRGVYRSTNGGATWEKILFISDRTGFVDLALNPQNPRVLFAAAWRAERKPWTMISGGPEGGLYRTTDGGENWELLEEGLPPDTVGRIGVTVSPANPDRVWALIEAEDPHGGVYRSDDGGDSWTRINRDRKLRQRAWYYTHVYADPVDENTVYALNTSLYRSVDAGKTFEEIATVPHHDNHDLWINPNNPTIIIGGNDGGAFVTLNGGKTWTPQRNQPTAELYSLAVDNQFPYRVYGPQQDNTTISVPSASPGGVSPEQYWYSVGGLETGPVTLHPDHPETFYSGNYNGQIERFDLRSSYGQDVRIYPEEQIGQAPKNLRFRFTWPSPVEVSLHNPSVVYHGSQYLHRTSDGGDTWEIISPDLTRNDTTKQRFAGGPITRDNTGPEIYSSVFTIRESPHSAGTIWVGSNDGLVHITQDGGNSWSDITPPDLPEPSTVSQIEVSPHQPGRAFLAVYRYRLDDFQPYIYRTNDFGKSWQRLTNGRNGIPQEHPVRVVREDPDRRGLLYAGTEFGIFVSFDDGEHWQSLQLNLPATPVTDLKVHRQDLVVATQGRSFWILDDVTALHELTDDVAASTVHLFEPRDSYRSNLGGEFLYGGFPSTPDRITAGARIRYYFAETPTAKVKLEILDVEGRVIRTFTTEEEDALPAEAGMNEFVWDLAYPEVEKPEAVHVWGFIGGYKAVPGSYQVRLTAGEESATRTFRVLKDPRLVELTQEDLEAQFDLASRIHDHLNAIYSAVEEIQSVRDQIAAVLERAKTALEEGAGLDDLTDGIGEELTAVENELMQGKNESQQDALNYPPKLDAQFANLYGHVALPDARPTTTAYERFDDLVAQWQGLKSRLDKVLQTDVRELSQALEERGIPLIDFRPRLTP